MLVTSFCNEFLFWAVEAVGDVLLKMAVTSFGDVLLIWVLILVIDVMLS